MLTTRSAIATLLCVSPPFSVFLQGRPLCNSSIYSEDQWKIHHFLSPFWKRFHHCPPLVSCPHSWLSIVSPTPSILKSWLCCVCVADGCCFNTHVWLLFDNSCVGLQLMCTVQQLGFLPVSKVHLLWVPCFATERNCIGSLVIHCICPKQQPFSMCQCFSRYGVANFVCISFGWSGGVPVF